MAAVANNNLPNNPLGAIQVNNGAQEVANRAPAPLTPEQIMKIVTTPPQSPFTQLPQSVPKVKEYLLNTFTNKNQAVVDQICALMKAKGCVLAGGSMLTALGLKPEFTSNSDFDFYINCKNIESFLTDLNTITDTILPGEKDFVRYTGSFKSSIYCSSFLRRNNIRSVNTFICDKLPKNDYKFDIMAVRNRKNVIDVVQNFDLTCCQLWFDGEMVYATHPTHIFNKIGMLQREYIPVFLGGNSFLKQRFDKYKNEYKFNIILDPSYQIKIEDLNQALFNKKAWFFDKDQINKNGSYAFKALYNYIVYARHSLTRGTACSFTQNPKYGIGRNEFPSQSTANIYSNKQVDGYDSEDFDEYTKEALFPVAKAHAAKHPSITTPEMTPEQTFYHIKQKLLSTLLSSEDEMNPFYINADILDPFNPIQKILPYIEQIKKFGEHTLAEGDINFAGDDSGPVYDLHKHKDEALITQESMENYLQAHKKAADKDQVDCYAKPYGCQVKLTLDDVRPIVSLEYYKNYFEGGKVKEESDVQDIVRDVAFQFLENTKTATNGWGKIYHHTICPFCLTSDERDKGCAYMSHEHPGIGYGEFEKELPGKLPHSYCMKANVIQSIYDKYLNAAKVLGVAAVNKIHLEYCVECGRPCVNHQHFDLNDPPGLAPPIVPNPANPDAQDYSKCSGGGRAELFARVLAIRNVLKENPDAVDRNVLRELCAVAANEAPRDPALMAKAQQMVAAAPADRAWNDGLNAMPRIVMGNNENAGNNESDAGSNAGFGNNGNLPNQGGGSRKIISCVKCAFGKSTIKRFRTTRKGQDKLASKRKTFSKK